MADLVRQAEKAILRYILLHRGARDTIEGIEKWWLPQSRPYSVADVAAALHCLAEHRLIRVWEPASAEPVYGLEADNLPSLEAYLRELQ